MEELILTSHQILGREPHPEKLFKLFCGDAAYGKIFDTLRPNF